MHVLSRTKFLLAGGILVALAACAPIEERCRDKHGANAAAYNQCVESQYLAIQRMLEHKREVNRSIPDVQTP